MLSMKGHYKELREIKAPFLHGFAYHTNPATEEKRVIRTFGDDLPEFHGKRILDWGAFKGFTTHELESLYPDCQVIGLERDGFNIHKARQEELKAKAGRAEYVLGDGYNSSFFRPGSFDAAFVMNSLYYVFGKMGRNKGDLAFSMIADLLKDDGIMLISGEYDNYHEHYRDYIILGRKGGKFSINGAESGLVKHRETPDRHYLHQLEHFIEAAERYNSGKEISSLSAA